MTQQLARVLSVVLSLLLIWLAFFLGLVNESIKPFVALPERVKLYSHLNYVFLLITPLFFGGVITISIHQLLNSKRDAFSYGKWWNLVVFTTLIVGAIALGNHLYLGYRVD
ncbi:hypothetical protein TUMSATVNIG1_57270 (plasmid) [Vibrio nigripulchritudo]|uniref:hypothetical protein n=1 Tax=Vibrio nigripulchritudo TaxID=28173 RepID=UPI00190B8790|nr:hypothetical protein [Vibrio nigripulchritudo]BCL73743.1 hypothetical protein VNTUMSATTG_56800 [Vibrio nigripulchritudo]BDU35118.1 hypothetical protein TUMSATVNIG1_57270 [Vibrio nigripulchritudo]